jgi:hypothetical protein
MPTSDHYIKAIQVALHDTHDNGLTGSKDAELYPVGTKRSCIEAN